MNQIRIEVLENQKTFPFQRNYPYKIHVDIGKWELSQGVQEKDLIKLRDEINEALGLTEIANAFNISISQAEKIKQFQNKYDSPCKSCSQKMKSCHDCVIVLQSPLERKLFLALKEEAIDFQLQARIHKDGSIHDHTTEISKETIRTIPDFLFSSVNGKTVCVYADGHTYHERTEYQALRDRSIDRDVQLFGYTVLRFTGKEINTNIDAVVLQIKQVISN